MLPPLSLQLVLRFPKFLYFPFHPFLYSFTFSYLSLLYIPLSLSYVLLFSILQNYFLSLHTSSLSYVLLFLFYKPLCIPFPYIPFSFSFLLLFLFYKTISFPYIPLSLSVRSFLYASSFFLHTSPFCYIAFPFPYILPFILLSPLFNKTLSLSYSHTYHFLTYHLSFLYLTISSYVFSLFFHIHIF